jgi:hypothetical protein
LWGVFVVGLEGALHLAASVVSYGAYGKYLPFIASNLL